MPGTAVLALAYRRTQPHTDLPSHTAGGPPALPELFDRTCPVVSTAAVPAAPVIERVELFPLHVPFREAVRETMARSAGGLGMAIPAEEAWEGGDFVIARLTAEDGAAGIGEAFVWLPETGVSPAQVIDAAANGLARYVVGANPFAVRQLRARMDANVARSEVAKGLLDMACYDLMGQIARRPAYDFIGGRGADELPLAALIPLTDPD